MDIVKKVVQAIKGKPEIKKEVQEESKCNNCEGSGAQCSSCTPIFSDTFGK